MAEKMDSERAPFESWVQTTSGWKACKQRGKPMHLRQNADGSYNDFRVNDRWCAWKARAHLAQPAQAVDVGALQKGFMTAESCGPEGRYVLKIKFQSLADLQAAHNTLARAISGEMAVEVEDGDACYHRCKRIHPHCQLRITRDVAPDTGWHWAVTMPDGHLYDISHGHMTFEQALADMQQRGVTALDAADAIWRRPTPASPAPDKEG